MPREYVTKPVAASPYRVDNRVTNVGGLVAPEYHSINGGPHVIVVSGVRVDQDRWPTPSGTI